MSISVQIVSNWMMGNYGRKEQRMLKKVTLWILVTVVLVGVLVAQERSETPRRGPVQGQARR